MNQQLASRRDVQAIIDATPTADVGMTWTKKVEGDALVYESWGKRVEVVHHGLSDHLAVRPADSPRLAVKVIYAILTGCQNWDLSIGVPGPLQVYEERGVTLGHALGVVAEMCKHGAFGPEIYPSLR